MKMVAMSWTPRLLAAVSGWKVQASRNSASACAAMAACERRRWASDVSSSRPWACAEGLKTFSQLQVNSHLPALLETRPPTLCCRMVELTAMPHVHPAGLAAMT